MVSVLAVAMECDIYGLCFSCCYGECVYMICFMFSCCYGECVLCLYDMFYV